MTDFAMTIDGQQVGSTEHMPVENPATNEVIGHIPVCSPHQLDEAVAAAQRAFPSWSADESARREGLERAAAALEAVADEIGRTLTAEQGKPLPEARSEALRAADRLRYWAQLDYDLSPLADASRGLSTEVSLQPLGVVAVITPWNYPIGMSVSRLAPALFVGNTIVLKPSPFAPMCVLQMGVALAGALPPGVVNVVSGHDDLGRAMAEHPGIRAISFTGSIATGKKVAGSAAPDLKRAVLELGGNDPAILLEDVDPEKAAGLVVPRAFSNCGQICYAVKRVYAPRSRYGEIVDAFAARASKVRVGDGMEEGVQMGPVNNRPQLARIEQLVEEAAERGATIATGGGRLPGPGNFYEPTVLADCKDGMRIVDEEQFGPAVPVIPYDGVDDAIYAANDTMFGLGASVWSGDEELARDVGRRLRAATVWINTHGVVGFGQPHTGSGWSGLGITGGTWLGLVGVSDLKVLGTHPNVDVW